jgi:hypothetical protein
LHTAPSAAPSSWVSHIVRSRSESAIGASDAATAPAMIAPSIRSARRSPVASSASAGVADSSSASMEAARRRIAQP